MPTHHSSDSELLPSLLSLHGLSVAYGSDTAVDGVDLTIHQGEILGLIGPNGAGKSTLLKAILGLAPLAHGSVEMAHGFSRSSIGYVPQRLEIDASVPFTVREFLSLNTSHARWWIPGRCGCHEQDILSQLESVKASHLIDRRLGMLSGGEFQRVTIAYALLRSPKLLLLDEPTTGVDHEGTHLLEHLLKKLRNERGIAVLVVSHDLHLVGGLCDRVCCLNRHMCSVGTPSEVMQDHFLHQVYGGQRLLLSARRLDASQSEVRNQESEIS